MLAAKAAHLCELEVTKGCLGDIAPAPVALEPPYRPLREPEDLLLGAEEAWYVPETPTAPNEWRRFQVWVPPDHPCDWLRNELMLKQLQGLRHRLVFDIVGGRDRLLFSLACREDDEPMCQAAFRGIFPEGELTVLRDHPMDQLELGVWDRFSFVETWAPPPYTELLTRPNELHLSPLEPFLRILSGLPPGMLGVFQVLAQPVAPDHDWHLNVALLRDLSYLARLHGAHHLAQPYAQQTPSAQLNALSNEVSWKAHADKPFFHVLARVGVFGSSEEERRAWLRALTTFLGVFQHGGRPLLYVTDISFRDAIGTKGIELMLTRGVSHRCGILLNSLECCSWLHIPPLSTLKGPGSTMPIVSPLPHGDEIFSEGTLVGILERAGESRPVFVPDSLRMQHIHLIGRPGTGKSKTMEGMCLRDIERGEATFVVDPHGDLSEGILSRLREEHLDRLVHFDPGGKAIPAWNLLEGGVPDRVADEFIHGVSHISSGWGDRLETLLRQALYGFMKTGHATLSDVSILLTPKHPARERLCKDILAVVDNPKARHFWEHEFPRYGPADFAPVQHKLTKLLLHDTLGLMFAYPHSSFDLRRLMDERGIFLADLSSVGMAANTLGTFLIALIHQAALSRSELLPHLRRPCHIYIDEVHRFTTDSIENILVELRKYECSMVLAHQYLSQMETRKRIDSLGVVGTTIAFAVTAADESMVARNLGGGIAPGELLSLEPRHAIARIGRDVVRLVTPTLGEPEVPGMAERAKEVSRARYCVTREQALAALRSRGRAPAPLRGEFVDDPKVFAYDTL
ncbi:MAG: ATP-binding protein [Candidatus Hydrogenedentes bacterium]|nr:ATP-binding protein [Candidatus Hydrogenedentota bacterium]